VSFGQGCEGEPLLAGDVIEATIKIVRKNTPRGMINMNTNGSLPKVISRLFDAGLDSARISINSAREKYYTRYYKPKGYSFAQVLRSIEVAKSKGGFVSINYLTMPGFTDSRDEFNDLRKLVRKCGIDMIQWRNLNFDPRDYFRQLCITVGAGEMLGVRAIIGSLRKEFPTLLMGYFNPTRSGIKRLKD